MTNDPIVWARRIMAGAIGRNALVCTCGFVIRYIPNGPVEEEPTIIVTNTVISVTACNCIDIRKN